MKTKLFLFCMLVFDLAYAGTPAMNDTSVLYAIALVLLGGLIGIPYLIKFIKKRREAKQDNGENEANDSVNSEDLGEG